MRNNPLFRLIAFMAAILLAPFAASAQTDRGPELDTTKDYYFVMTTNNGEIFIKLFADKAPITVRNIVNLAEGTGQFRDPKTNQWTKRPYYNGTQFHRVIPEFMIQGGDPTATGRGGPGFNFKDEFDPTLKFDRGGLLAMANAGPGTNGSQFFLTEKPTPHLTGRHTIFGEVLEGTDGLEIITRIARVNRDRSDKPSDAVVIEKLSVHRLEKGLAAAAALEQLKAASGAPAAPAATEAVTPATEDAAPATEAAPAATE